MNPTGILESKVRLGRRLDRAFAIVTRLAALLIPGLLFGIVISLTAQSLPTWKKFGWSFLFGERWDPVSLEFGARSAIVGTVVTSFIAIVIAVPISFGIAIFLTELAPRWLRGILGVVIELLAAIPSIVYGMWGLFVLAPMLAKNVYPYLNDHVGPIPLIGDFFRGPPLGLGMLTAGLILSVMIIPFISSVMRDVFLIVPPLLKESGIGLGATTWEVIFRIIVPYTRTGILGGIILGLGRALGETMAVTFVIGNSHDLSRSLLMPGNTISSSLANEFTEAVDPLHTSSLIALGLLLFLVTLVVLTIAKLLTNSLQKSRGEQ